MTGLSDNRERRGSVEPLLCGGFFCRGYADQTRRFLERINAAPARAVMLMTDTQSTMALLSPVAGLSGVSGVGLSGSPGFTGVRTVWQTSHLPSLSVSTWPVAGIARVSVSPQAQERVSTPSAVQVAGSGFLPVAEGVGVVGADDVRPVPGADAGRHGGAVLQEEGVVIGGKAGGRNFAAHLQVLHLTVGADIAVDKHPGYLALGIPDQDGLNLAVGHLDAGDIAIEGDQLPRTEPSLTWVEVTALGVTGVPSSSLVMLVTASWRSPW